MTFLLIWLLKECNLNWLHHELWLALDAPDYGGSEIFPLNALDIWARDPSRKIADARLRANLGL